MISAYLNRKMLMDFEILTFDTIKAASDKSQENMFEILLVGEKTYSEDKDLIINLIKAKKIFILHEDGISHETDFEMIPKYQSMETLVGQVLEKYAGDEKCKSNMKCGKNATRLITFYSSEHHGAQSLCALSYSQLLADRGDKVLYLNLHGFSGFEDIMNISYEADITDFMYFVLKHSEKLLYKLEGMKRNIRGVDYLPPALDFADLVSIKPEEWCKALDLVLYSGDYTDIVLDIDESCQGFYDILDRSDRVYALYNDASMYGRATFSHFKRLLEVKEKTNILNKMTSFSIPYEAIRSTTQLGNLPASEIGAYMRGVM
jgi:hypothetical protein